MLHVRGEIAQATGNNIKHGAVIITLPLKWSHNLVLSIATTSVKAKVTV